MRINKGQFALSRFRNFIFHYRKSKGHRLRYFYERYKWNNYPKKHKLNRAPLLVDIETSSVCNLYCPMCYRITEDFKKNAVKQFMDMDLFKKIVNECAASNVYALRLSYRGEPFINPDIIEMIKYAKKAGIPEVSSLTNGVAITPEMFEEIIKAGLDWLTISFDGLNDKYEEIRRPAKFDEMYDKIKMFSKLKNKFSSVKPVLKIQSIWTQIKDDPQAFYDAFSPYVDNIATNPLIDYNRSLNDKQIVLEEKFDCPFIWQRLTIFSDGNVPLCINDENAKYIIGNIRNSSLIEIWNGKAFNEARKAHSLNKGIELLPVCNHCYLPRKTKRINVSLKNGQVFCFDDYVIKDNHES
ncbi:MAG: radical SAM protein [Candidatus Omnitrophica bacterium]|nr:radical SAM protein [Candidatus Omnitrophota bacterium]